MKQCLLSCILFCLVLPSWAQGTAESYNYPLRPGSEGWKNAKNHAELRTRSQVPNEVIKQMSTATLLNSVLHYPLIGDLLVFSTFREGAHRLRENFYAFDSLMSRQDILESLIPAYIQYDPEKVNALQDPIEVGEFMLGLTLLEFIISEKSDVSHSDAAKKNQLVKELLRKSEQKRHALDKYGDLGMSTTLWALGKIADKEIALKVFSPEFIENGFVLHDPNLDSITEQIERSLK